MSKSKIKHLKELFRQSGREPDRYMGYCEEDDDMPVGLFESQKHKFRFYFTCFPNLQDPVKCVRQLDGITKRVLKDKSFQVSYNSIQEKLFATLYKSVSDFDDVWFQKNDLFLQELPLRYQFALVAVTNKSQQHIQAVLKNQDTQPFQNRVRKWKQAIHGYLPIFFPLYDRYKHLFPKDMKMSVVYNQMIQDVCPHLSGTEIQECLMDLVKDVRYVFSICPKTTRKMILWRGLRSAPSSDPYPGLTSMSLNPFHTLHYTGRDCCLQQITLLPKTPLLFIGGLSSFKKELECVLPDNLQFYEVRKSMETIPIVRKMKDMCPSTKETKRILIQHVVVL